MCAAIFSAVGKEFNADAYLSGSALQKCAESWKIGEASQAGFQVIVCDDEDLQKQIVACVGFMRRNLPELKQLRDYAGVESIDFRIAYFLREGVAALAYTLPEELHLALAHARATLTFCVYPCSTEKTPNKAPEP